MNWEKLKPIHFFEDPVPHVYTMSLFDTKEYDKLYENQSNLDHTVWQDFDARFKTGYEFKEHLTDIDFAKEIVCLWFFKERSDKTVSHVVLDGKPLAYTANTWLITTSKNIKFVETKRKHIRHPFVQIDLSLSVWEDILKRFNKIS